MDKQESLVSICVTFFNAEKHLHRILDSSLNQTYRNVEVVIIDDVSNDKSGKIIGEYASRDSRVRYYKNEKRVGVIECLRQAFEKAKGEYVIWPGADDWFARDFMEKGIKAFLAHPDAAGILPKFFTLKEVENDKFKFSSEAGFPSGVYSAEWFVKRKYRYGELLIGQFALVRKKDAVSLIDYVLKQYCYDQSLPEEFRAFSKRALGIDMVFFLEILTKYKNFVWDNSLIYLKIVHSGNIYFNFKNNSLSEFLRLYYYTFLNYRPLYKSKWPVFYREMKIYWGAETFSTIFINFLRSGFRPSFLNIKESRRLIRDFFRDFSILEMAVTIAFSFCKTIYRFLNIALRFFMRKSNFKNKEILVFRQENFLDSEGRFRVS